MVGIKPEVHVVILFANSHKRFFQKTEPKPNRTRGFFQNRTEVQKYIPNIPTL